MSQPLSAVVFVRARLVGRKGVAALLRAREAAEELVEAQPWNDEAKALRRYVRRAIKYLEFDITKRG